MPDALIMREGGNVPLEIFQDDDAAGRKLWAQLEKLDHEILLPAGSPSWNVLIRRDSHPMRLRKKLPRALAGLDPQTPPRRIPAALLELGVIRVAPMESATPRVALTADGWSWSGSGPDMNGYVAEALSAAPDVPAKLRAHGSSVERHVFIWVGISSVYPGWSSIRAAPYTLPSVAPALPEGVTHVWVASLSLGRAVVYFSPDEGWINTTRVITQEDAALFLD